MKKLLLTFRQRLHVIFEILIILRASVDFHQVVIELVNGIIIMPPRVKKQLARIIFFNIVNRVQTLVTERL